MVTCEEDLARRLCFKWDINIPNQGLLASLTHREALGANLREASAVRSERKSKERGTANVTARTGRKTGAVTEGTFRSITGWIGLRASAGT